MAFIDKYVIFSMLFSFCFILFKSGMINHKWALMEKKDKIFSIIGLIPYVLIFSGGIVLVFIFKEVVL